MNQGTFAVVLHLSKPLCILMQMYALQAFSITSYGCKKRMQSRLGLSGGGP